MKAVTRLLRLVLIAALVPHLVACFGGREACDRTEPYQSSRSGGELSIPDDLTKPTGGAAMRVPDIEQGIAVRGPCGDAPPTAVVVERESETPPAVITDVLPDSSVPGERAAPSRPPSDLPPIVIPSITGVTEADVTATVSAWLEAWRRGDIETFLSFYDESFASPVPGESRDEWEEKRRLLLADSGFADIRYDLLVVAESADGAEASFVQEFYPGDGRILAVMKRLRLVPQGFRWLIVSEEVDAAL